jgi:hypothetical protein
MGYGGYTGRNVTRTEHDQPLRFLHAIRVCLRIAERFDVDSIGFFNLVWRTMTNEDWLAPPLNNDLYENREVRSVIESYSAES